MKGRTQISGEEWEGIKCRSNSKKIYEVRNAHGVSGGNPVFLFVIICYKTWSMVCSVDSKMIFFWLIYQLGLDMAASNRNLNL